MSLRCKSAGRCDFRESSALRLGGTPFLGSRAAVRVDGCFLGGLEFTPQAATLSVNTCLILTGTGQTYSHILFRQLERGRCCARPGHFGFECFGAASLGVCRRPRGPRRRAAALRL